ncbi:MAG TPA: hypothetical protein VHQ64_15715 [Pyrinomonadaceae bacterium]|jgi:hypothetical protein|nr:hypothetical protein [Pyrinomonadaceae bacterium]
MSVKTVCLCLIVSLQFGCAYTRANSQNPKISRESQSASGQEIDLQAALRIARKDASNRIPNLDQFAETSCEQDSYWRIFFESTNSPSIFEVVLAKTGGVILGRRQLSNAQGALNQPKDGSPQTSKETAIDVAQKDATRQYGDLKRFTLTVCKLQQAWRVIYAPASHLNGGGPEYLIDKRSPRILDKKYYQ